MGCVNSCFASNFLEAANRGDIATVGSLMQTSQQQGGRDISFQTDGEGGTALHYACGWKILRRFRHEIKRYRKKNTAVDAQLLSLSGMVSIKEKMYSELQIALEAVKRFPDTSQVVDTLLFHGLDVNAATNSAQITPLMCAAALGRPSLLQRLISAGSNVNFQSNKGETALFIASTLGHVDALRHLISSGSLVDGRDAAGVTCLMSAAALGHAQVVYFLLNAGAKVDISDNTGKTALIWAASLDQIEAVRTLLHAGAEIDWRDTEGYTALAFACARGYSNTARALVLAGANADLGSPSFKKAPLHLAAEKSQIDCVKILLAAGADGNFQDGKGMTPLMIAVQLGNASIAQELLRAGVDVNLKDAEGKTALFTAILHRHMHIADDILTCGQWINVDAIDKMERSVISVAKSYGYTDLVNRMEAMRYRGGVRARLIDHRFERPWAPIRRNFLANLEMQKRNSAPRVKQSTPSIEIASIPPPPSAASTLNSDGYTLSTSPSAPVTPTNSYSIPPSSLHQRRGHIRGPSGPQPPAMSQAWAIPFSDLQLGSEIGRGSFARVYKASWQETEVAVKIFDLPGGAAGTETAFSDVLLNKIRAEADLLCAIRHPHVLAFLGVCDDPPCVVTEHCSRGSLFDVLRKAKTDPKLAEELTWSRRLQIAVDAAAGMLHLHQRSIVHRDFKSPNLLISSTWQVKVADLGLSKLVEEAGASSTAGSTTSQMNPRWMAPEVIKGEVPTSASDVYSYGLVLWELLAWEMPWTHLPNPILILAAVMNGQHVPIPAQNNIPGPSPLSPALYDRYVGLLKRCIDPEPSNRPAFAEIAQTLKALLAEEIKLESTRAPQGKLAVASAAGGAPQKGGESLTCVVCMENPPTAGLVHQKEKMVHRCCCSKCAALLKQQNSPCPMCRRKIDDVLLHFF